MTPGSTPVSRPRHAALARQFRRFILVGASNTAISFIAYAVMIWLGVLYWPAGGAAFLLGAANGYVLNRRWTFNAADSTERRIKYLVLQLGGLGATTALLWLFVSSGAFERVEAYAVTVPLVTVVTFLGNRAWVFSPTSGRRLRA